VSTHLSTDDHDRRPSGRPRGTRDRILDAATELIHEVGLAHATTKAIAQRSGLAEGTIYKHFSSKEELFLQVLRERLPGFIDTLKALPERVGRGDLRDTVADTLRMAFDFYRDAMPMIGAMLAEPSLLASVRGAAQARSVGPYRGAEALAHYLAAERDAGRLPESAEPEPMASLLIGGCLHEAYLDAFANRERTARKVTELVGKLMDAVLPAPRETPARRPEAGQNNDA
jgi:AcrR family transcriptional regulator